MQEALRNRLTYGPIMLAGLLALLWLDRQIEKWTSPYAYQLGLAAVRRMTPAAAAKMHVGLSGVGVLILMMIILPIATTELLRLFTAENVQPYRSISATGSALLTLHAFLTQFSWFQPMAASSFAFIIVFVMILTALRRAWGRQTQEAITHMAGTVLAVLYLGGLAWFLVALRVKHSADPNRFQGSTAVVVMILLVVKFTDIGAFFGGRALGRHKLIPWLSPGKTWEGLICGMATAALVGYICSRFWPNALATMQTPIKAALFGAVIGGIGQAGDLLESLMKRDAEVKDSGSVVPGFGGVLDIIDSPLFAAPFAYLLFSLI
jgi:phosphatidate cytidylyltransferase